MTKPKNILEISSVEFDWDKGNQLKIWNKHGVSLEEAEQVFFDQHRQLYPDPTHSSALETRKIIVGKTQSQRLLFVVFIERNNKIRIISARDLNKRKEIDLYETAA